MRPKRVSRRSVMVSAGAAIGCLWHNLTFPATSFGSSTGGPNPELQRSVEQGLNWVAQHQTDSVIGRMTLIQPPSRRSVELRYLFRVDDNSGTVRQEHSAAPVDYLLSKCRRNGLIRDPKRDNRYTYGHCFGDAVSVSGAGEEEDVDRRVELTSILERAVSSALMPRPKQAVGVTLRRKKATLTKARRLLRKSRGCVVAGTRALWFPKIQLMTRSNTFTSVKTRTVEFRTAQIPLALPDLRLRRPPVGLVNVGSTTANIFRRCGTIANKICITLISTRMATGITRIFITRKSSIARALTNGFHFGIDSTNSLCPSKNQKVTGPAHKTLAMCMTQHAT